MDQRFNQVLRREWFETLVVVVIGVESQQMSFKLSSDLIHRVAGNLDKRDSPRVLYPLHTIFHFLETVSVKWRGILVALNQTYLLGRLFFPLEQRIMNKRV